MNAPVIAPEDTPRAAVVCPRCARPFLAPTEAPTAVIECPCCGVRSRRDSLRALPPPEPKDPRPRRLLRSLALAGLLAAAGLAALAIGLQRLRPPFEAGGDRHPGSPRINPGDEAAVEAALAAAAHTLSRPDWRSALPFILHADRLGALIEQYHASHPWVPIALGSVKAATVDTGPDGRSVRLTVESDRTSPITLHLEETPDGWKLDWERLVDARDYAWRRFHEEKPTTPVLLDVLALRGSAADAHFAAAGLTPESGLAVRLDGPRPGLPVLAIVPKASDLGRLLQRELTWEHPRRYQCRLRLTDPGLVPPRVEITHFSGESWEP